MNSVLASGGSREFTATTADDGEITYDSSDGSTVSPRPATGDADGCDEDTYRLNNKVRPRTSGGTPYYKYWINVNDGVYAGITMDQAVAALNSAADAWQSGKNPCGLGGPDSASTSYLGRANYHGDFTIRSGGSVCDSPDYNNTIDFGNLDGNGNPAVALTCTWAGSDDVGTISDTDIRFNTSDYKWILEPYSSRCDNHYDLQSVATHEIGHAWGLADFYPRGTQNVRFTADDGEYQTMFGYSSTCRGFARSLGRGDVRGWLKRYDQL